MAYSEKDWGIVKAFYEQGLSLAEIVDRKEVKATGIQDRASISRKSNKEGWIKGKMQHLATEEIKANQALDDINATKRQVLNATELSVHNTLMDERLRDEKLFRSGNKLIASIVLRKIKKDGDDISYLALSQAGKTFATAQDKILGKEPATVINNSNALTQQTAFVDIQSPEEIRRLKELYDSFI